MVHKCQLRKRAPARSPVIGEPCQHLAALLWPVWGGAGCLPGNSPQRLGLASAGTHFRYGSIRWWVGQDSLNGALDINGRPVYQAVFEVKGAWRRDYSWGALFNEAWRERDTAIWRNAPVADGDFSCASVRGTNNPLLSGVQCFEAGTDLIKSAQDFSR